MKEMVLYLLSHTNNREGCFTGLFETASLYSNFVKHVFTVGYHSQESGAVVSIFSLALFLGTYHNWLS